jgi:hypothetical protein
MTTMVPRTLSYISSYISYTAYVSLLIYVEQMDNKPKKTFNRRSTIRPPNRSINRPLAKSLNQTITPSRSLQQLLQPVTAYLPKFFNWKKKQQEKLNQERLQELERYLKKEQENTKRINQEKDQNKKKFNEELMMIQNLNHIRTVNLNQSLHNRAFLTARLLKLRQHFKMQKKKRRRLLNYREELENSLEEERVIQESKELKASLDYKEYIAKKENSKKLLLESASKLAHDPRMLFVFQNIAERSNRNSVVLALKDSSTRHKSIRSRIFD